MPIIRSSYSYLLAAGLVAGTITLLIWKDMPQAAPLKKSSAEMAFERQLLDIKVQTQAEIRCGEGIRLEFSGQPEAAERAYLDHVDILRRHFGPTHAYTGFAWVGLERFYTNRNHFEDAELCLQRGLAILRACSDQGKALVPYTLCLLGELELKRERPSQAEPYFQEALNLSRRDSENMRQEVSQSLRGLGATHIAYEDYSSAEQYTLEALCEAPGGSNDWGCWNQLRTIYGFQGRDTDAVEANQKCDELFRLLHPEIAAQIEAFEEEGLKALEKEFNKPHRLSGRRVRKPAESHAESCENLKSIPEEGMVQSKE
ncbi:MAG: hypothetical protein AMXMBFR7_08440 [Planctomycetota bacterium]